MSMTITEKILARSAGLKEVVHGQRIKVTPHYTAWYDATATKRMLQTWRDIGLTKMADSDKKAFFIDHYTPPQNEDEAQMLADARAFHKQLGVRVIERMGIGHQVAGEIGIARPGELFAHGDAHVNTQGAIGCLALGGMNPLVLQVEGTMNMTVPGTIKVLVHGTFPKGTNSRDFWLKLFGDIGPDGAKGCMLEFAGPTIEDMSIDDRMTLCNSVHFAEARGAIINPDQKTLEWAQPRSSKPLEPLYSDEDATFEDVWEYDVSDLVPYVAVPPNLYDCRPLEEFEGRHIDQAYLGSCASGRLDDLRFAARILKGHKKHPEVRLNIIPTSQEIMSKAMKEGVMEILIEGDAFTSSPSCDYCFGKASSMAPGETAISTGTLNIPGRMGSTKADIFQANPGSVVASAIEGKITDPRRFL